jgi:hypothetical protein
MLESLHQECHLIDLPDKSSLNISENFGLHCFHSSSF